MAIQKPDQEHQEALNKLADATRKIEALASEKGTALQQLAQAQQEVGRLSGENNRLQGIVNQRGDLSETQSQLLAVTAERDNAIATVTKLTGEVATLTASQKNFDQRLVSELCKLGVRNTGVSLPAPVKNADGSAVKMSVDEQIESLRAAGINK